MEVDVNMTTAKSILRAGMGRPSRQNSLYQKTSSTNEVVAGLIGQKGTADYDMKLYATGGIPACVFDYNISQPAYVSGAWEDKYAVDNQSVPVIEPAELFIFEGLLDDGETSVKYKLAAAEAGTGKLIAKNSAEVACAIFMEGQAASGADLDQEALFLGAIGGLSPVSYIETVTAGAITDHVIALSYSPVAIGGVGIMGANAGAAAPRVGVSVTAMVSMQYSHVPGTKALKVASTDAATIITVQYSYLPGNE